MKTKRIIVSVLVVCLSLLLGCGKASKYEEAVQAYEDNTDLYKAVALFSELEKYKDSEEYLEKATASLIESVQEGIKEAMLKDYRSKIGSLYTNATEKLYHGASCKDLYIEYSPDSEEFTCYMDATYTTNIFDFFGTSTTSHTVIAVYKKTKDGLKCTSFDIQ